MGKRENHSHWKDRRVLAALLGVAIFLLPIACAVGASLLAVQLFPRPSGTGALALWWLVILATSTAVFGACEVVARRALPLKVLLRMGLAFPGRAPKRLAVAWRAASVRDLDRMVAEARERGIAADSVDATEKVVTLAAALGSHRRKVLLGMGLALPARAPKGRAAARRAASVEDLDRMVAEARERGVAGDSIDAAERIVTLAASLSAHDRTTRGHSERVRAVTDMIAAELRLSSVDRDRLRWSALLHDVGKLAVHPDILNKPSDLSEVEWEVIRRHPLEGAKLTAPLAGWLGPWADTIAEHHERFDGKGYPRGLRGRGISLGGRIVAVADSYDVMTATRTYRRPLAPDAARRELAACAGTQFDPDVVRAFLSVSVLRLRLAAPLSWLASVGVGRLGGMARVGAMTGRSVATGLVATGSVVGVTLALPPHHSGPVSVAAGSSVAAATTGSQPAVGSGAGTASGTAPSVTGPSSQRSAARTDTTEGHGSTTQARTPSPLGSSSTGTQGSTQGTTLAPAAGTKHALGPPTSAGGPPTLPALPTATAGRVSAPSRARDLTAFGGCRHVTIGPQVSLHWAVDAASGITSSIVLRSQNGRTFAPIATLRGGASAYTDLSVGWDGSYSYKIEEVSSAGVATTTAASAVTPLFCS